MKFVALAKHWVLETILAEAKWIDSNTAEPLGENPFTDAQLRDFKKAVRREAERMIEHLEKNGVIVDGTVIPSYLD